MAENTIAEDIAEYEAELKILNDKIKEMQHIREVEEGGGNARFRTQFADIGKLYKERNSIKIKLTTLYRGSA